MEFNVEDKILNLGINRVAFPFSIKKVIDFGNIFIVYVFPKDEKEYEDFIKYYDWKLSKGPVYGVSEKGEILWQWKTRHVNDISKVSHKSNIILLDPILQKEIESKDDLLINCQGWNFYLNPETGEKIREEQTK